MARQCNGSTDVGSATLPSVAGLTALTIAGWMGRSSTGETVGAGISDGPSGGFGDRECIFWYSDGNIYSAINSASVSYQYGALGGTGIHHIALCFDGTQATDTTRQTLFIDGVLQTLTAVNSVPTSLTASGSTSPFTIGKDSSDRFCGGYYADFGVWYGVALSRAEIWMLSRGKSPLHVRRGALRGYWPLWGENSVEKNLAGVTSANMTFTGTTWLPSPPQVKKPRLPRRPVRGFTSAAAAFRYPGIVSGLNRPSWST